MRRYHKHMPQEQGSRKKARQNLSERVFLLCCWFLAVQERRDLCMHHSTIMRYRILMVQDTWQQLAGSPEALSDSIAQLWNVLRAVAEKTWHWRGLKPGKQRGSLSFPPFQGLPLARRNSHSTKCFNSLHSAHQLLITIPVTESSRCFQQDISRSDFFAFYRKKTELKWSNHSN